MFSFEDGEPDLHCCHQSLVVPQLLSCVLVVPVPLHQHKALNCAGNWGPKAHLYTYTKNV